MTLLRGQVASKQGKRCLGPHILHCRSSGIKKMLLDWYNLRLDDHSWRQGMALNSKMMIKLVTTNALGVLQLPWSSPSCKFLPAGAQEKWVAPKTHTNSLFHLGVSICLI
jgi:hypothetical protein